MWLRPSWCLTRRRANSENPIGRKPSNTMMRSIGTQVALRHCDNVATSTSLRFVDTLFAELGECRA